MKTNRLLMVLMVLCMPIGLCIEANASSTSDEHKVYMHYMAWFGPGQNGNHWSDGTAQEPLIGYYNSQSWATHIYHILLSSACGVDGMVVNVRTAYDETSFKSTFASLKRITDVHTGFNYSIGVSYDDQDRTQQSAELELQTLKNQILPTTNNYLHKDGQPVIFVWDYPGYLTSVDYRNAVSNVFTAQTPLLLRNEIDSGLSSGVINSYYPWVQGYTPDGSNWGNAYLNWYYQTIKNRSEIDFGTGAVWPGFDDRQASWGQNRWIDRRAGETYEDTWDKVHLNDQDLDWVIIETWNDWNEGTEIEPSVLDGFKYVKKTAANIAQLKGTQASIDDDLLDASTKVYEAAALIESQARDSIQYYTILEQAIYEYIEGNGSTAILNAEKIIYDSINCTPPVITPILRVNGGAWQNGFSNITVFEGDDVTFGPSPLSGGAWSWTGPNSYTSSSREINFTNLAASQSGTYVATYVNTQGCRNTQSFDLTVNDISASYYIVNRWQGTYLYDAGAQVGYSSMSTDSLYQWKLVTVDGHKLIQNLATGDYMNVEQIWATIECTNVATNYWSAHWIFENYQGYTRIRNRWQGADYIHIEDLWNLAQRSNIFEGAYSGHWTFVPVGMPNARTETEVSDDLKDDSFNQLVYPNPATTTLNIPIHGKVNALIQIIDNAGRVVYSNQWTDVNNTTNLTVDISDLESGIYLVSVVQEGKTSHQKIIKE